MGQVRPFGVPIVFGAPECPADSRSRSIRPTTSRPGVTGDSLNPTSASPRAAPSPHSPVRLATETIDIGPTIRVDHGLSDLVAPACPGAVGELALSSAGAGAGAAGVDFLLCFFASPISFFNSAITFSYLYASSYRIVRGSRCPFRASRGSAW